VDVKEEEEEEEENVWSDHPDKKAVSSGTVIFKCVTTVYRLFNYPWGRRYLLRYHGLIGTNGRYMVPHSYGSS
jgi:hypothetical protein